MGLSLSVEGLRAGYGAVEVLHGVDLEVPARGVTALLGRNGAGKTTALSALAGLLPTRAGTIRFEGTRIDGWSARRRAAAGMLLVPERRGIFPGLSVRENLTLFAADAQERSRLQRVFETFPRLAERATQRAGSMSGGEQQMLAMSRVLIQEPRLLLLDEVSFGLAPQITATLFEVIAEIATRCAVVLVEQYVEDALALADVVYVLERGVVCFAGEPGELDGRLPSPEELASAAGRASGPQGV